MLKRYAAALTALSLLAAIPAQADYVIKDGAGASQTFGSFGLSGVQFPKHVMVDPTTGAAIGVSGNPLVVGLPAGAATAAKQPALGTGGSPSADVLSVQGVAGGTPQPADTVVRSASTDRGGTITAGGTAQQFMAANATRRGFIVQNQSTGDLYVNCLTTAAGNQTSLKIPAGALYSTDPHHSGTGACSIFGATTAQAFYAREF
jgi:hypothetical protein